MVSNFTRTSSQVSFDASLLVFHTKSFLLFIIITDKYGINGICTHEKSISCLALFKSYPFEELSLSLEFALSEGFFVFLGSLIFQQSMHNRFPVSTRFPYRSIVPQDSHVIIISIQF